MIEVSRLRAHKLGIVAALGIALTLASAYLYPGGGDTTLSPPQESPMSAQPENIKIEMSSTTPLDVSSRHENVSRETVSDENSLAEIIAKTEQHNKLDSRLDAIVSLSEYDDPYVGLTLRSLLDDPSADVRAEVVESLGLVGGSDAVTGLAYALSDQSEIVRELAVEALLELGSEPAIAALAIVLDDSSVDIREFTVEELAEVGGDAATAMMRRFLSDRSARVRRIVIEALAVASENSS